MSHARRHRRTLLLLTACVAIAASTGCLRSSPLRLTTGDVPAPASPPAASTPPAALNLPPDLLHDDSINRTSGQPTNAPPVGPAYSPPLSPPPPPILTPSTPESGATIPDSTNAPSKPPATPLLDAAIKRVEAIQEIQRQSLINDPAETEPRDEPPTPIKVASIPKTAPTPTKPHPATDTDLVPAPTMPPLSANPVAQESVNPAASATPTPADTVPVPTTPFFPLPDLTACLATETPAQLAAIMSKEARNRGDAPDPDQLAPKKELRIADFQLCRHIAGFGSIERLPENSLRLGQQILIYCEMIGLQYEPTGNAFLSRMSSRLELHTQTPGKIAWSQDLGSAEDCCRRVRRDYYVSYCIEFPKTLEPGSYCLRLIQTDLVGHQTTSADLPITLRP